MNLNEWMNSERSPENDAVCIFLHEIKARLERAYPKVKVELNLHRTEGNCPCFMSINLRYDPKPISMFVSYIPHELSSTNPTELMARSTPEEIVATFIKHMECYQ